MFESGLPAGGSHQPRRILRSKYEIDCLQPRLLEEVSALLVLSPMPPAATDPGTLGERHDTADL